LALDVNACVIKEQILTVTVGIALAHMQEVIGVNILILLHAFLSMNSLGLKITTGKI